MALWKVRSKTPKKDHGLNREDSERYRGEEDERNLSSNLDEEEKANSCSAGKEG